MTNTVGVSRRAPVTSPTAIELLAVPAPIHAENRLHRLPARHDQMLETVTILRPFPAGTDPGRSDLSYLPFGPATVLEECRQEYAHYAGQKRNPLLTGIRREALEDAMRCPEDN
jgi:hypothetical protein